MMQVATGFDHVGAVDKQNITSFQLSIYFQWNSLYILCYQLGIQLILLVHQSF